MFHSKKIRDLRDFGGGGGVEVSLL